MHRSSGVTFYAVQVGENSQDISSRGSKRAFVMTVTGVGRKGLALSRCSRSAQTAQKEVREACEMSTVMVSSSAKL